MIEIQEAAFIRITQFSQLLAMLAGSEDGNVSRLVHKVKYVINIHGPLKIKPNVFGKPLSFVLL